MDRLERELKAWNRALKHRPALTEREGARPGAKRERSGWRRLDTTEYNERRRISRAERIAQGLKSRDQERREERRAAGRCLDCGEEGPHKRARCDRCTERIAIRRRRRHGAGLCHDCGGARGETSARYCEKCRRKRAAYRRELATKKVSEGCCADCFKPRGVNGSEVLCRKCLESRSVKAAERKERIIKAGGCRQCGKPRGEDGTRRCCRPCADKNNAAARAKYVAQRQETTGA